MRGRRNFHLLFKDENIVPLKQILGNVHREGSIDLAILFCPTHHLMPFQLAPNTRPKSLQQNASRRIHLSRGGGL